MSKNKNKSYTIVLVHVMDRSRRGYNTPRIPAHFHGVWRAKDEIAAVKEAPILAAACFMVEEPHEFYPLAVFRGNHKELVESKEWYGSESDRLRIKKERLKRAKKRVKVATR